MKKNLMTVLILALLIVNIALTGVMLVSIVGTNKKTAQLVDNITTAMNLELTVPGGVHIYHFGISSNSTDIILRIL